MLVFVECVTLCVSGIADLSPYGGNGTEESSPAASEPARIENAIPQQPPVEIPPTEKPEKEDPAPEKEDPARKGSSHPVVKHKTTAATPVKTSPAVPGNFLMLMFLRKFVADNQMEVKSQVLIRVDSESAFLR